VERAPFAGAADRHLPAQRPAPRDTIDNRLNGGPERATIRALPAATTVDRQIATALPAVTDAATRRHLQDARDSIAQAIDPRAMRTRPGAGGAGGGRGVGAAEADVDLVPARPGDRYDFNAEPFLQPSAACWADLVLR
jgi:hypothetical protein